MQLRDYQADGIEAIRAAYKRTQRRVLYVLPTGGGKTLMFCWVAHSATERGRVTLILVHRRELIAQTEAALRSVGETRYGVIAAGRKHTPAQIQIASKDTLVARLPKYKDWLATVDAIIVDEAHHATAGTWQGILDAAPGAYVLGVTATPCRKSGAGLGTYFDTLIEGPAYSKLQAAGYLVPARVFAPSTVTVKGRKRGGDYVTKDVEEALQRSTIVGDAIESYQRWGDNLPAIAFCYSRKAVDRTAAAFRDAGYAAYGVDGTTPLEHRDTVCRGLATGDTQVLVSCDLISEGFDVPVASVGIMLRPTASLGLWIQQAGRMLRPAEGKRDARILDHVGNTLTHGFPDDDRDWDLKDGAPPSPGEAAIAVVTCQTCFRAIRPVAVCPHCGAERQPTEREIQQREGELAELERERMQRDRRREEAQADSYEDLLAIEQARGYKPGWAHHRWRARQRRRVG